MNTIKIAAFREELEKEAAGRVLQIAGKAGKKTKKSLMQKFKESDKAQVAAGAAGAAAVVGGANVVANQKIDKRLDKKMSKKAAVGRMGSAWRTIKDVATGRQAREGFATGRNIARESVRRQDATPGMVRGMDKARNKTLAGAAKTTGFYAGAGATVYGGTQVIGGGEKQASLSKEAAGRMAAAWRGAKNVATGKQFRKGVNQYGDTVRRAQNAGRVEPNAGDAKRGAVAVRNMLEGGLNTATLYAGGAAAGTYGVKKVKNK